MIRRRCGRTRPGQRDRFVAVVGCRRYVDVRPVRADLERASLAETVAVFAPQPSGDDIPSPEAFSSMQLFAPASCVKDPLAFAGELCNGPGVVAFGTVEIASVRADVQRHDAADPDAGLGPAFVAVVGLLLDAVVRAGQLCQRPFALRASSAIVSVTSDIEVVPIQHSAPCCRTPISRFASCDLQSAEPRGPLPSAMQLFGDRQLAQRTIGVTSELSNCIPGAVGDVDVRTVGAHGRPRWLAIPWPVVVPHADIVPRSDPSSRRCSRLASRVESANHRRCVRAQRLCRGRLRRHQRRTRSCRPG